MLARLNLLTGGISHWDQYHGVHRRQGRASAPGLKPTAYFRYLLFLVSVDFVTVEPVRTVTITLSNGIEECILRWSKHQSADSGIVQDRCTCLQGLEGSPPACFFSFFCPPGHRCRRLMNTQIVRSWHQALCCCPSFTDGSCRGLVLTQPVIAAAVLLSQRRPVSSRHCVCLQRQHCVAPQIHLAPWELECRASIAHL